MPSIEILIQNVEGALKDLKDNLASQGIIKAPEQVQNQREKTVEEINAELSVRL